MKISTFCRFLVLFGMIDTFIYYEYKTDYSFLDNEETEEVLETFLGVPNSPEIISAIPVANEPVDSQEFVDFLKQKEGFSSTIYICKGGAKTIGYGFTQSVIDDAIKLGIMPKGSRLPAQMSKQEADTFLRNTIIPTYQKMVLQTVKAKLNIYQLRALISFAYNLGEQPLRNLAEQLNKNDYDITDRMLKYCYAKHKKLNGLVTRRKQEVKLWATND